MTTTRCDLHLHSAASIGNDEWYTRLFGCPESYADPIRQYEICKARGMSLVTLTDHDTLAGGLLLVDRPDFFLSEEVTTKFPENGCVMHVLAWNITEAQHEELQLRRDDIYRLCEYLNREAIAHALAHPLLSPTWQLDAELFEKALLLFPALEAVNGLTDRRMEPDLAAILDRLTPEVIAALSRKHGIPACGPAPHRKALTAGSDDHVHRRCGTVYTEAAGARLGPGAFLAACMAGQARLAGQQASLDGMAMCAKHTTYHHLKERGAGRDEFRNPFVEMMDVLAGRDPGARACAHSFVSSLFAGVRDAGIEVGKPFDLVETPAAATDADDARVVDGVAALADRVIERALRQLPTAVQDFDLYRVFGELRDLASALVVAVPMFCAADHFGKQEKQARRVREGWSAFPLPARPERLALFSDSIEHVDGVSTWCRRFVEQARAAGREVLVPTCGASPDGAAASGAFRRLPALTSFAAPLYDHMHFHVPSLIGTLRWLWRESITHVELATPGPMGLMGLLCARVLRLPVTASYHTEVPALIELLGGNPIFERAARRYLGWFYGQVDRVFAFSAGSRAGLVQMGVDPAKLSIMPVAVDPNDFSPAHRSAGVFDGLNLEVGDRPVVLSVGRLSKEKNLPLVISAVERLQDRRPAPVLVVAGDGPERACLEASCLAAGHDFVRFVGLQRGDTLKRLYASARLFVFASRVDTLGLVNMEAMSSGVPVLVPSDTSIAELVTHGVSAECYEFGATGLAAGITRVLDDPPRAARLAAAGRQVMIDRWNDSAFPRVWQRMTEQL